MKKVFNFDTARRSLIRETSRRKLFFIPFVQTRKYELSSLRVRKRGNLIKKKKRERERKRDEEEEGGLANSRTKDRLSDLIESQKITHEHHDPLFARL